jgi:hypothetical protein
VDVDVDVGEGGVRGVGGGTGPVGSMADGRTCVGEVVVQEEDKSCRCMEQADVKELNRKKSKHK